MKRYLFIFVILVFCGQFNNNRYRHNGSKGYLNDWFVNTAIGIRL